MKRAQSVAAFLMIALAPTAALAAEIDTDEKKVRKLAVPNGDVFDAKPKGLCVCIDDPVTDVVRRMGIITYQRVTVSGGEEIEVYCQALRYSGTTGDRNQAVICDDWVPLAK